jgi:hypothetical protein
VRKGISILFGLVIMLSGAQLTIATHFCGGEVAATKVSLSGKLASCGMERTKESSTFPGTHLTSHCCDDNVITIGILNNFTAPVLIQNEYNQNVLQIFYLPVSQSIHYTSDSNYLYTDTRPPGGFSASAVNLSDICDFRI